MRYLLPMLLSCSVLISAQGPGLKSSDLLRLRFVGEAALSPDATRIAYSIVTNDGPRRPAGDLWIMNTADGSTHKFCAIAVKCDGATWSPNGEWIAYHNQAGLHVAHADGSGERFIAKSYGTN